MRDKRLLRQLKKIMGTQDVEKDWGDFLLWLSNESSAPADGLRMSQTLLELLDGVEKAYGQSDKMLAIANHSLEVSSEELSTSNAGLSESNRLIEELLNGLDEGFLVFNREGICSKFVSSKAKILLETEPAGRHLNDILKIPESEKIGMFDWWNFLFEDGQFASMVSLAPEFYIHSDIKMVVKLEFKPIYDNGSLRAVIMISKDIGAEVAAKNEASETLSRLEMVQNRFQNPAAFMRCLDLLPEIVEILREVSSQPNYLDQIPYIKREIHTLKGAMMMVSISSIGKLAHRIESDFDEALSKGTFTAKSFLDAATLFENINQEFRNREKENLSLDTLAKYSGRFLEETKIFDFYKMLVKNNSDRKTIDTFLKDFVNVNLMYLLKPLEDQVIKKAALQHKKLRLVIQCDPQLSVDPSLFNPLVQNLVHLVNNSIDHAIDTPMQRVSVGKPEAGVLRINVAVSDKYLMMTVSDDGKGIQVDNVRDKATKKGLISKDATEKEVLQTIFADGFSTQEVTTLTAGRGVGLGAVKSWLEQHHGSIEVTSVPHQGTTFKIVIDISNPTPLQKAA